MGHLGCWLFFNGHNDRTTCSFFKKRNYSFGCVQSLLQHAESLLCHMGSLVVVHGLSGCVVWEFNSLTKN